MAHVIVQNTREGDAPPTPERADDGAFFRFGMYFDGGQSLAWADSFDDLMDVMHTGYLTEDEQTQLISRITIALKAQAVIQAQVFVEAEDDQIEALSPEEEALVNGSNQSRPQVDEWTSEIPLVLVSTAYQPHTETPRPVSSYGPYEEVPNLWWINPEDPETLLTDLHSIGYVRVVEVLDPIEGHIVEPVDA